MQFQWPVALKHKDQGACEERIANTGFLSTHNISAKAYLKEDLEAIGATKKISPTKALEISVV